MGVAGVGFEAKGVGSEGKDVLLEGWRAKWSSSTVSQSARKFFYVCVG